VTVNLETTGQEPSPITTLDDLVFGTPNNDSLNAADQDDPYTGNNQCDSFPVKSLEFL
jgi:hypothetical protein